METSKLPQKQNTLVRALPYILLVMGALKLADWLSAGRSNSLYLASAVGFALVGGSGLVQNRLVATGRLSQGLRWGLLVLAVLGLALALSASVLRWL